MGLMNKGRKGNVRPYFNNIQAPYVGGDPPFYSDDVIPEIDILKEKYLLIYDELLKNISTPGVAEKCFKKLTLKKQSGWKQIELKLYGVEYREKIKLFPKTMDILNSIPGMSTAYFSILSAKTRIPAHPGDTDAYYRVHLGLSIPATLPGCGLEVAGMRKSWREGKCTIFNDAYCHSAWNETDSERVVLIVDIMRPEFRDRAVYVNSGVRATLYYVRLYEIFFPVIELLPRALTRIIRPAFHWMAFLWHSIYSDMAQSEIDRR